MNKISTTITVTEAMQMLKTYQAFAAEDCGFSALDAKLAASLGFPQEIVSALLGGEMAVEAQHSQIGRCEVCGNTDILFKTDAGEWRCHACGESIPPASTAVTRVILVGRHASDLPEDILVVQQENILWSTNHEECRVQFDKLVELAELHGAAILLQNVPGILAGVLVKALFRPSLYEPGTLERNAIRVGVIIAVPGERAAGVEYRSEQFPDEYSAQECARLVNAANGRVNATAENGIVSFTVDPVTPFMFSHIEWL